MYNPRLIPGLLSFVATTVILAGCSLDSPPKADKPKAKQAASTDPHEHAHMHGPHGGPVLELGDDEYHAEWLHDEDSGRVTIFILDSAGKKEVPIEAAELLIETTVAGKSSNYNIPSAGDADEPSAKFEIEDKALVAALEGAGQEGTEAVLKLSIAGKDFSAKFERHEH